MPRQGLTNPGDPQAAAQPSRQEGRPAGSHGSHPPNLLAQWARVARRLRAAKHLALFLDFDGTLASLRRRPEEVQLDESTRRALRRLAHHPRIKLWIISGRVRADVRKRVNLRGIAYLGLHGWDREGRSRRTPPTALGQAKRQLTKELAGLRCIWVEDKGFSFIVHYREAAANSIRKARAAVRRTVERSGGELRAQSGKKSWELLPREVEGKGPAVHWELAKLANSALPIFVGDDKTDESAFRALPGGITVHVGKSRRTWARYRLRNPAEVRDFLESLQAMMA